ncbi:hypothetical protein TNCV_550231 [Trichonephila clavipes]|nr:hypothetical protein TNCV_550231 [Trichonephila clavipes]
MRRVSRRPELTMAPGQIQPVQIPDVPEPVQIPDVPEPVHIPDVPETPVKIPDVPEPPVQIHSTCPRTYADSRACADSPRARHLGADGCTRPAHVVRIWTPSPRTPAASHGTLYF